MRTPGENLGKEAEMSGKKDSQARRFSNEKHGRMLLEEVRVFMRQRGLASMHGHWEEFDAYAADHKTLKHWAGETWCWDTRHRAALHRWEGDREQADQVARVKDLLKQHGMKLGKIYDVINAKRPSRAKDQLSLRRPWDADSLRNLAQFFGVSEEYLRTGESPVFIPPALVPPPATAQQELPVPPWTAAPPAAIEVEVQDAPGQSPRPRWDVDHASDVLDELEQLAHAGKGCNCKALNAYLDYARRREPISDITESILAGTSRL
jgi:hypothetical protein